MQKCAMRTTLTIDDDLMRDLKEAAHREGLPFKRVVNRVLRIGLGQLDRRTPKKRFRQRTFAMGSPRPEFGSLDKALRLAGELEDLEIARKLQLRK
jgi:hypothetical protein